MRTSFHVLRVSLLMATTLVVASCGGSDGGNDDNGGGGTSPPTASNQPPASASQSSDGFIAYLKTLVPTQQNTVEPLDVATFVAPTNNASEPDPAI